MILTRRFKTYNLSDVVETNELENKQKIEQNGGYVDIDLLDKKVYINSQWYPYNINVIRDGYINIIPQSNNKNLGAQANRCIHLNYFDRFINFIYKNISFICGILFFFFESINRIIYCLEIITETIIPFFIKLLKLLEFVSYLMLNCI